MNFKVKGDDKRWSVIVGFVTLVCLALDSYFFYDLMRNLMPLFDKLCLNIYLGINSPDLGNSSY